MRWYGVIIGITLVMCITLQLWAKNLVSECPFETEDGILEQIYHEAESLQQNQKYQEAFDLYLTLRHLQDSTEQEHYIRHIERIKTQNEVREIQLLNNDLKIQSKGLYLLIFALLLICILLLVMILINRQLKKQLLLTKEKAEHSDHLKSAFLANMNHEIRTPLNAIAGFTQLLVDETDSEIAAQYISIIKGNNELLLHLLNDVLDISKIESNTIKFTYSNVYLPTVINDLYEVVRLQIPDSIQLIKDSVPEIHIHTDQNRLVQILSNLLSNAVKHTIEGEIRMGYVHCAPDKVRFYVSDTGEGISPELQQTIFERFIQAVENHSKGVGLGLALCKGFVDHLGGEIGVESVLGEGSTFWFTLPLQKPET